MVRAARRLVAKALLVKGKNLLVQASALPLTRTFFGEASLRRIAAPTAASTVALTKRSSIASLENQRR